MAGQMCSGHVLKNGVPNESKAYCEGMSHRIATNGATQADNPHIATSDAGVAWIAGWSVAHAEVGAVFPAASQGCCSVDLTKTIVP